MKFIYTNIIASCTARCINFCNPTCHTFIIRITYLCNRINTYRIPISNYYTKFVTLLLFLAYHITIFSSIVNVLLINVYNFSNSYKKQIHAKSFITHICLLFFISYILSNYSNIFLTFSSYSAFEIIPMLNCISTFLSKS